MLRYVPGAVPAFICGGPAPPAMCKAGMSAGVRFWTRRHTGRKGHDIAAGAAAGHDLVLAGSCDLIDTDHRLHGDVSTAHTAEFTLEFFFRGINEHLGAFAEDDVPHLDEGIEFTLPHLVGVDFVYVALVVEHDAVDLVAAHVMLRLGTGTAV